MVGKSSKSRIRSQDFCWANLIYFRPKRTRVCIVGRVVLRFEVISEYIYIYTITYVYDYLPKIVDVKYERAMKPSVADRVAQLGGLWRLEKKFMENTDDCDRHS